jgi:hypothetical protein
VENQRLKKLVVEQALDIDMLKELTVVRKLLTRNADAAPWVGCRRVSGFPSVVRAAFAGQHRSILRKPPRPAPRPADERLVDRLREIEGSIRVGVEDRSPDPAAGGLDAEPQANTPCLAPGGAQAA